MLAQYTFENLSKMMVRFTETLNLQRFAMCVLTTGRRSVSW
jgi:hypothetical protein